VRENDGALGVDGESIEDVEERGAGVLLTDRDARWAIDCLREILAGLELELNEEKSRVVDAEKETFDFLGFTFRRVWNRDKTKRATLYYPSKKSQKRLRERMKQVFSPAAPVAIVERIGRANRILRGWVNYFRVGNSSSVFHDIRSHVEMKVRRVLQRQAHRYGRGWKRYDYAYLYQKLGLYADYRVRWQYA